MAAVASVQMVKWGSTCSTHHTWVQLYSSACTHLCLGASGEAVLSKHMQHPSVMGHHTCVNAVLLLKSKGATWVGAPAADPAAAAADPSSLSHCLLSGSCASGLSNCTREWLSKEKLGFPFAPSLLKKGLEGASSNMAHVTWAMSAVLATHPENCSSPPWTTLAHRYGAQLAPEVALQTFR